MDRFYYAPNGHAAFLQSASAGIDAAGSRLVARRSAGSGGRGQLGDLRTWPETFAALSDVAADSVADLYRGNARSATDGEPHPRLCGGSRGLDRGVVRHCEYGRCL